MNQLINLDSIIADGDVKSQRKMQVNLEEEKNEIQLFNFSFLDGFQESKLVLLKVRRVQKYVETLDMLKIKNSTPSSNGVEMQYQQRRQPNGQRPPAARAPPVFQHPQQQPRHSVGHMAIQMHEPQQASRHSTSGAVVVTTKWETFDSALAPPLVSAPPTSAAAANINPVHHHHPPPKLSWEFFD